MLFRSRPPRQDALAAVEQRQPGDRPVEGAREEGRSRRRGRGRRDRQSEHQDNPIQQRGEQPNRTQSGHSGNEQSRPPHEREHAPAGFAQEDTQPVTTQRPMEQPFVGEQPVVDQHVVQHSVMQENTVGEVRLPEFAPAPVAREQRPSQEPMIERQEAPPVAPKPQAAPAWKMEPVILPSDLVMIETQSKVPLTYQEPELPRPVRTPRSRSQSPAVPEEPLQQVETGKERSAGSDAAG